MTSATLCLGPSQAPLRLYLPTPPVLENGWQSYDDTVRLNGNHWRKILIILAKLSCGESDWRVHRDKQLLQQECIDFADQLSPAAIHLIAGKASWERVRDTAGQPLIFTDNSPAEHGFKMLDTQGKLWQRENILLTPYPDYRQFPNQLIETARSVIQQYV